MDRDRKLISYSMVWRGRPAVCRRSKVVLYSLPASGQQELALDALYGFSLAQMQFDIHARRSVVAPSQFELADIVANYQLLELEQPALSDISAQFIHELRFLPSLYNYSSTIYFNTPLTLQESARFSDTLQELLHEESQEAFHSNALAKLLSWWRHVALKFNPAAIVELRCQPRCKHRAIPVHKMLQELDLSQGSAELTALQRYVSISRQLPDINYFSCNINFSFKATFLEEVLHDSRMMALVSSCCYYTIEGAFQVLQFAAHSLYDRDLVEQLEAALRPRVEVFYQEIMQRVVDDIDFEMHVGLVLDKTMRAYRSFFSMIRGESENHYSEKFFRCTLLAVTNFLSSLASVVLEDPQLVLVLGERRSMQARQFLDKFMLEISKNGVLLAYKCMRQDFVTMDLLLRICNLRQGLLNPNLYETGCAQLAYVLLTVHSLLMQNSSGSAPVEYEVWCDGRRDFLLFVDELRIVAGQQPLAVNLLAINFSHQWALVRDRLNAWVQGGLAGVSVQTQEAIHLINHTTSA